MPESVDVDFNSSCWHLDGRLALRFMCCVDEGRGLAGFFASSPFSFLSPLPSPLLFLPSPPLPHALSSHFPSSQSIHPSSESCHSNQNTHTPTTSLRKSFPKKKNPPPEIIHAAKAAPAPRFTHTAPALCTISCSITTYVNFPTRSEIRL